MMESDEKIIEVIDGDEISIPIESRGTETSLRRLQPASRARSAVSTYIVLPIVFLTVTLLGGLRLGAVDNSFIFLKPALICLVFAGVTLILFFRSGLISLHEWLSESLSILRNTANTAILLTLFTATVQLFNALLPEHGLPFWIVGFCFFWTLWNNLFSEFNVQRLIRSLGALFGLAFIVKFLVLANLTAPEGTSWLQRMIENPGREAFTWLLDLPRYSSGTGYIHFFTVVLYLIGLYLTPATPRK
jgi:hypothetical protein